MEKFVELLNDQNDKSTKNWGKNPLELIVPQKTSDVCSSTELREQTEEQEEINGLFDKRTPDVCAVHLVFCGNNMCLYVDPATNEIEILEKSEIEGKKWLEKPLLFLDLVCRQLDRTVCVSLPNATNKNIFDVYPPNFPSAAEELFYIYIPWLEESFNDSKNRSDGQEDESESSDAESEEKA